MINFRAQSFDVLIVKPSVHHMVHVHDKIGHQTRGTSQHDRLEGESANRRVEIDMDRKYWELGQVRMKSIFLAEWS